MRGFDYDTIQSFDRPPWRRWLRTVVCWLALGAVAGGGWVLWSRPPAPWSPGPWSVGPSAPSVPAAVYAVAPPTDVPVVAGRDEALERLLAPIHEYIGKLKLDRQRQQQQCQSVQGQLAAVLRGRVELALESERAQTLDFVLVPAGSFFMGRTKDEVLEGNRQTNTLQHEDSWPRHEVRLPSAFFISQCEVTVGQYRVFAEDQNVVLPASLADLNVDETLPASGVTWQDAAAFCGWLSRCSGQMVRLPTETEWEYAARGRGGLRYGRADGDHFRNQPGQNGPVPVGTNADDVSWCGAMDLCGNVSEWCLEQYDEQAYRRKRADAPAGDTGGVVERVYRGGAWDDHHVNCQAATRRRKLADQRAAYLGFRVVLIVSPDGEPSNAGENDVR